MVRQQAENGRLPTRPPSEEIATRKVEVEFEAHGFKPGQKRTLL